MTEESTQEEGKYTPMGKVWVFVLLSLLICGSMMVIFQELRLSRVGEVHQKKVEALRSEQQALIAYQEYLKKNGVSRVMDYFTTTIP